MKTKKEYFCNFKGYECKLVFDKYVEGNRLCISLVDKETGEPIAKATVNVPEWFLPDGYVIIKNYSENEGMTQALIMAGIIESTKQWVRVGYASAQVCKLLITP